MSRFQFYVTIRAPSVSPRIQLCTPKPSTFQSSFTFFENRSHKRISSWNISGQKNRLQTSLLSLSQERLLSTSKKNWESYYLLIEFPYLQQQYNMKGGAWQKYHFPQKKHQWNSFLFRWLSGILVKQEAVFSVLINCRTGIYSSSSLLYSNYLDEENPARHTRDM